MRIREKRNASKGTSKPLYLILLKRAAILFFVGIVLSLFYWIVGNYSFFLDETQTMLLGVLRASSLLLIFDSCLGELASIINALRTHRSPRMGAFIGYAFGILLGCFGLFFSNTLISLSSGVVF